MGVMLPPSMSTPHHLNKMPVGTDLMELFNYPSYVHTQKQKVAYLWKVNEERKAQKAREQQAAIQAAMDKNLAQFSLTAKKEIMRKKDVIDDLKKKIAEEEARHATKKRTAVVSEPVTVVAPKKVVPAETEAERLEREEIQ